MNALITAARPILEALYFVANVLLVAGLGMAYRQLVLIKQDMRTRNQRAAAEKAIDACNHYLCGYVDLLSKNHNEKTLKKIPDYEGPIGDFTRRSIPPALLESVRKRFELDTWLMPLNHLESIAASFVTGVADEQVGFRVIGRTFCLTVEDAYDIIAWARPEQPYGYWTSIVELYHMWRPRLTKGELEMAKREMEARLARCRETTVAPIGVAG